MSDPNETYRDQQARDIFFRAAEIPSREARAGYLEGACLRDPLLRSRVEALLENHCEDSFLETPVLGQPTVPAAAPVLEGPGTVIGRYKLLQRVGEGGCGVV